MFVDEPPEFSYEDGLFHIRQRVSDEIVIERVMRPSVFFASIAAAVEVARKHRPRGVFSLVPDHAASDSGKPSK